MYFLDLYLRNFEIFMLLLVFCFVLFIVFQIGKLKKILEIYFVSKINNDDAGDKCRLNVHVNAVSEMN